MAHKWAGIVLLLLVATPAYSQDGFAPIGIELLSTEPTTVITAQPFTVGYRVRYLDLTQQNEEVIFFVDEVTADYMEGQVGGEFEVVDVVLADLIDRDGEYWQDIFVTLKIVSDEKGPKVIPKIMFNWVQKDIGQDAEELPVSTVEALEEVHLNYVSTVTPDPYLDIISGLKLGDFSDQAKFYRFKVPVFLSIFLFVWLVLFLKWLRTPRQVVIRDDDAEEVVSDDILKYVAEREMITYGQARRALHQIVEENSQKSPISVDVERAVFNNLHALFIAAMPEFNLGDSPHTILANIERSAARPLKSVYTELAKSMVYFWDRLQRQGRLELGKTEFQLNVLYDLLNQLKRRNKAKTYAKWYFWSFFSIITNPRKIKTIVGNWFK